MANNLKASSLSTIPDLNTQCLEEFIITRIMEVKQRITSQFQDTSKAKSLSPSSTKDVGSEITPKDIVENLQDSPFIKTSQQSAGCSNSSSVENHKDVVAQKSPSAALLDGDSRSNSPDFYVNNNGLQQVSDLLQAPPQDGVPQESSSLLDDLAQIKQGLQQCFNLLHQQAPPQEEVVQDIVESPSSKLLENRQESSSREGDTTTSLTKVFKKIDDVTASMQLLVVDLDGIVNKVDESTLRERICKFEDEVQCRLKVIIEKVKVHARDEQDAEVKNRESCATILDQNEGSIMTTNRTQDDIKNIGMSSSTVAEPCVINNQDLEKVKVHARDEQDAEVKNRESCATILDQNEC